MNDRDGNLSAPCSADAPTPSRRKYVPEPTWSLGDLDLASKQPPLPREELDRLSRLALIDVAAASAGGKEEEHRRLNQDLANMLHMVQQVTDYYNDDDEGARRTADPTDDVTCSSDIYDVVRGVSAAPLRKGREEDPLQQDDAEQAKQVWTSLLLPKTTRKGGGHQYFAIVTSEEGTGKSTTT